MVKLWKLSGLLGLSVVICLLILYPRWSPVMTFDLLVFFLIRSPERGLPLEVIIQNSKHAKIPITVQDIKTVESLLFLFFYLDITCKLSCWNFAYHAVIVPVFKQASSYSLWHCKWLKSALPVPLACLTGLSKVCQPEISYIVNLKLSLGVIVLKGCFFFGLSKMWEYKVRLPYFSRTDVKGCSNMACLFFGPFNIEIFIGRPLLPTQVLMLVLWWRTKGALNISTYYHTYDYDAFPTNDFYQ